MLQARRKDKFKDWPLTDADFLLLAADGR